MSTGSLAWSAAVQVSAGRRVVAFAESRIARKFRAGGWRQGAASSLSNPVQGSSARSGPVRSMSVEVFRLRSPAGFGRLALIVAVIAGFLSFASPAQAQVFSTCDQWGQYTQGSWTIYNDVWGANHGPQCLTVNSIKSWYVDSTQSGGGVKSYPNTAVQPGGATPPVVDQPSSRNTRGPTVWRSCEGFTAGRWSPKSWMPKRTSLSSTLERGSSTRPPRCGR